jgi:hypothetical protein
MAFIGFLAFRLFVSAGQPERTMFLSAVTLTSTSIRLSRKPLEITIAAAPHRQRQVMDVHA